MIAAYSTVLELMLLALLVAMMVRNSPLSSMLFPIFSKLGSKRVERAGLWHV